MGKFLTIDPLFKGYAELTPYQFASNSPIQSVDLDGAEAFYYLLLDDNKGGTLLKAVDVVSIRSFAGINYVPEESFTVFYKGESYSFGNTNSFNTKPGQSNRDAFIAFVKNPDTKKFITNKSVYELRNVIEKIYKGIGLISKISNSTISKEAVQEFKEKSKPKYGDLTQEEVDQIQSAVDKAGRPIEVGGSAANGTRRNVGTDLPIGKGSGTKSDIDYLAPPSSFKYFEDAKLPGLDPKSGIIPGQGNPNIGPYIRFEPNAEPVLIPAVKPN